MSMPLIDLRDGSGIPVLLLHAFPLDHRMWAAVAHEFPAGRRVVALELPGAGPAAREALPEPSIDASAQAVAAALDSAGIARAVVVGLSMGGYVALALAERRPDLVAALGLVDTKSEADSAQARDNRLRIAASVESSESVDAVRPMARTLVGETTLAARPELSEQVGAWIGEQSPRFVAWSQRAMAARPDRTHVLERFTGPVTVVVGDEDTLTPFVAAEHMVAASRHALLVVVPHAGHLTAVEQPGAVAAALAELAQRADVAG